MFDKQLHFDILSNALGGVYLYTISYRFDGCQYRHFGYALAWMDEDDKKTWTKIYLQANPQNLKWNGECFETCSRMLEWLKLLSV